MTTSQKSALLAILVVGVLGSGASYAQDPCLHGCPEGASAANRTINRPIYALSNNGERKFADWVAYRVTRASIGPTQPRTWKADDRLPADETLAPGDYRGASAALGIDRGHQAPLASFTGTPHWRTTNFLSNITPQATPLNQGPWERLESAERALARKTGVTAVHVVTGPLYERVMRPLPNTSKTHSVPSGYWKVVAIERGSEILSAAFIMHQDTPRNHMSAITWIQYGRSRSDPA